MKNLACEKCFFVEIVFLFLNITPSFSQADIYVIDDVKIDSLFAASEEVSVNECLFAEDTILANTNHNKRDFLIGFVPTFLSGAIAIAIAQKNFTEIGLFGVLGPAIYASLITGAAMFTVAIIYRKKINAEKTIKGAAIGAMPYTATFLVCCGVVYFLWLTTPKTI